ncbi:MAG: lysylphosphatidylglycerol synthase transmembrane domain-containing protein [Candidatus Daviesbacteria bacterium]|nr:lysylphosphatidylglycerol synthase transmembrane domain-containing protein [Candidatus Daviesbacteria bacterium]
MTTKTILKIVFNTFLGLVLIYIWLQFVDVEEIVATISQVNIPVLMIVFVFMLASPVARAVRLKIFLSEIKDIKLTNLIFLNGVAMMLNFFIPIRAGEIVKGIYLHTNYGLSMGKAVIWVFLDRFLDFLVVLLLAAILMLFVPTTLSITFIIIITIILVVALLSAYIAIFQVTFSKKIVNFLSLLLIERHIKIYFERFSHFILDSFSILKRSPKDLSLMGGVTVLSYAADASIWYFTFKALGFNQDFIRMYLGQILSALTYLIPAAPGYVGSAEASGTLILSGVFGIDTNLSSAMIVLFHILSALFILIFGLVSVFNLKMNLGVVLKKALNRR